MTSPSPTPLPNDATELRELFAAICDETATPDQFRAFEEALQQDTQAVDYFAQFMQMHVLLHRKFTVAQPHNADTCSDAICNASCAPVASASPLPLAFLSNTIHGPVGYLTGWPAAYLVATVVFGIGALIGTFTYVSHPVQVATRLSGIAGNHETSEPQMEIVGRISGMVDCQWADKSSASFNGAPLPLGRKYALSSGLIEITYDTGAIVILQGPVTYEIESKNGGFLSVGKLTGKMEVETAKGFSVRTPTATVTDLGTEFCVEVSRGGGTEAHVIVGSVKFVMTGSVKEQVVHAGSAVQCDGKRDGVTAVKLDAGRFVRFLPTITEGYAELVLSMRPVAYYRMARPENAEDRNVLFDSASGMHHGMLHTTPGYPPRYGRGLLGDALWFGGPSQEDYAIVLDYPQTKTGQLTVSAWVYATSRPIWASIAKNWGRMKHGQFFLGLTADDGDLSVYIQDENKNDVSAREGSDSPFPRGRWQHVAVVVDGQTVRLFRNGLLVASSPVAGINPLPAATSLGIGTKPNEAGDKAISNISDCWHGWMQQMAIFNRALTSDELDKLARRSPVKQNNRVSSEGTPER